jgi:hypothetical protein
LFSIDSFCFGSLFFCWLSCLYSACGHRQTISRTITCWHYLLSPLFEWFNCIITNFLGAHHCCYFS